MKDDNSTSLSSSLMVLVYFYVILCLFGFGYILYKDSVHNDVIRPRYSKEELLELTENRKSMRFKERAENWDYVENGIHIKTGLKNDEHLELIIVSCTSCHSAKLITQNRATREGWKSMIVWMQETQGLNDLGISEPKILDYLSEHYAPQDVGRRRNLDIEETEWYILNL